MVEETVTRERPQGPLIGGETAPGGRLREVTCPYDGRLVGFVMDATPESVNRAVVAAHSGAVLLRRMPAHQRAGILLRAAEILRHDRDDIAALITGECAKPIRDARAEVERGISTLTASAEEARRLVGEMVPMDASPGGEGKIAWTRREPLGIIAAITPFNFPLNLALHKVGPAIASGNAVILKPAPATPLTGLRIGRVFLEAGLPADALSVLPGGTDVAQALVTHPDVAMVTFTGSVFAGRAIQAAAPHKKVTLELGNAGAVAVEPDADADRALERCVPAAFSYSGQVCISLQRVYVHSHLWAAFSSRFCEMARALKVGDPFDEDTRLSALISPDATDRVRAWIDEAVAAGGRVLCAEHGPNGLIGPTVLANAPARCKVSREEVFGPVAVLYEYEDFDTALSQVNDTPFGLQAGIFTRDISKAMHAVEELRMGTVLINEAPNFRQDTMPYGGIKDSGVGREGPHYAIQDMTEPKLVILHPGSA